MKALLLLAFTAAPLCAQTPECRLARQHEKVVLTAARAVVSAFARTREMPFKDVAVNASKMGALRVDLVTDSRGHCKDTAADDPWLVDGLCQTVPGEAAMIRCSAGGVATLLGSGDAHPALEYVLAHEVSHLLRKDEGAFVADVVSVPLGGTRAERLELLKAGCETDPLLREEELADADALSVLALRLREAPLRQALLQPRGSLYWNVDEILLAADRYQKRMQERAAPMHPLFDPDKRSSRTDIPFLEWAAKRFVCDALSTSRGVVRYPLRTSTHPSPEQRLRRVAERIDALARDIPADDDSARTYQRRLGIEAFTTLQQDVGAILNRFLQQDAEYLEGLHTRVCSIVNLDAAELDCRGVAKSGPEEP
jgi:hypothetical protein